jgi:hypothetical protein
MNPLDPKGLEADPRFPSGPWTGFFLQRLAPGRNTMTVDVTFRDRQLKAKGADAVGPFTFRGSYDPRDGKCRWTKQYLGKHPVSYSGVNEGQGIWGVWEIRLFWGLFRDRGVFHIWPQGMTPPVEVDLTERAFHGDPGEGRVVKGLAGGGLLLAVYLFFRYFGFQWLEDFFR